MKKCICFIINPISGIGKKGKIPKIIEKHLDLSKFDYNIQYTSHRGHASTLTEELIRDGVDIVAIVGGDGSINEVGAVVCDTLTSLAIIPSGSGNGIARHLGIPLKLKDAIQRINTGKVKTVDTFLINNKPAIGFAGFGFDAHIAKKFDEFHKRGLLSYVRLVIKEYSKFKGFEVALNGRVYQNLFFCSIANTSQFGNGFKISPESKMDDTLLEIVCIKKTNLFGMINLVMASLFGSIHQSKNVEIIPLPYGQLKLSENLGHIDGDPITINNKSIDFQVVPKSLKIIT